MLVWVGVGILNVNDMVMLNTMYRLGQIQCKCKDVSIINKYSWSHGQYMKTALLLSNVPAFDEMSREG